VCWSSTKRTSSWSHWKLSCSRHDITENLPSWHQQSLTHFTETHLTRRGCEPLLHICGCFSRLLLRLVSWVTFTMDELIVCYFNMYLKKEQNNISWLFAILRKERKLEVKIRRGLFHILACTSKLTVDGRRGFDYDKRNISVVKFETDIP
jgi:hypothetical protein